MSERKAWEGSDRRSELPPDWKQLRADADVRNPERICHICGEPGGDSLDHKNPGNDHSPANLDWAHDRKPPHCHRRKSALEGVAARAAYRKKKRPPKPHPGLLW